MLPPEIAQLDPWQIEVLEAQGTENILNIHRQCGKSTIAAIKCLIRGLTLPGSLHLVVSRSFRQALETGRKVRAALIQYQAEVQKQHPDTHIELGLLTDTKSEFELPNGSRVVCLPPEADTIRNYSAPSTIILDEASRIPDDAYFAIRPMRLASKHWQLWMISTPFGQRGFYYHEWQEKKVKKWQWTVEDSLKIGRVSQQFIDEEKRKGELYFRQEFMCDFLGGTTSLFTRPELEATLTDGTPLMPLYNLVQR